jgi:hypothetical protein
MVHSTVIATPHVVAEEEFSVSRRQPFDLYMALINAMRDMVEQNDGTHFAVREVTACQKCDTGGIELKLTISTLHMTVHCRTDLAPECTHFDPRSSTKLSTFNGTLIAISEQTIDGQEEVLQRFAARLNGRLSSRTHRVELPQ